MTDTMRPISPIIAVLYSSTFLRTRTKIIVSRSFLSQSSAAAFLVTDIPIVQHPTYPYTQQLVAKSDMLAIYMYITYVRYLTCSNTCPSTGEGKFHFVKG